LRYGKPFCKLTCWRVANLQGGAKGRKAGDPEGRKSRRGARAGQEAGTSIGSLATGFLVLIGPECGNERGRELRSGPGEAEDCRESRSERPGSLILEGRTGRPEALVRLEKGHRERIGFVQSGGQANPTAAKRNRQIRRRGAGGKSHG
jgi:hypothetical protein